MEVLPIAALIPVFWDALRFVQDRKKASQRVRIQCPDCSHDYYQIACKKHHTGFTLNKLLRVSRGIVALFRDQHMMLRLPVQRTYAGVYVKKTRACKMLALTSYELRKLQAPTLFSDALEVALSLQGGLRTAKIATAKAAADAEAAAKAAKAAMEREQLEIKMERHRQRVAEVDEAFVEDDQPLYSDIHCKLCCMQPGDPIDLPEIRVETFIDHDKAAKAKRNHFEQQALSEGMINDFCSEARARVVLWLQAKGDLERVRSGELRCTMADLRRKQRPGSAAAAWMLRP